MIYYIESLIKIYNLQYNFQELSYLVIDLFTLLINAN